MKNVKIKKITKEISETLSFPGDKSLSHRAIIFGSLAEGVSEFQNVLEGEDCVCTREAFAGMGVKIGASDGGRMRIEGQGLRSLKAPSKEIYCGNSGTSMRLLLGVLAGQPFQSVLTGDPSLSSRPMRRVTDYLKKMGAGIDGKDNANYAPLTVKGRNLEAIGANLPVSSAQVKSALLLAGLYARGETRVTEPEKSRDHTERFLKFFGAKVKEEGLTTSIEGGQKLEARSFEIAGDISGAAFFMAMAALIPVSKVSFRGVLWNPTRTGVVEVLKRMGVEFQNLSVKNNGPEFAADFAIHGGAGFPRPGEEISPLRSFEINKNELPSLIDEIPILTVLATQAEGTSVIHDADELRVKETDRIDSMVGSLSKMGAKIWVKGNTLYVEGPTPLKGAVVNSFKDHRTAMSLIVAGMIAKGETGVEDVECVRTSFPAFFELLGKLGVPYQFC